MELEENVIKAPEQLNLPLNEKWTCDFCKEQKLPGDTFNFKNSFLNFIDIYYRGDKSSQSDFNNADLVICTDCLESKAPDESKEYCVCCANWQNKDDAYYPSNEIIVRLFDDGECAYNKSTTTNNIEIFNQTFPEHKIENLGICESCRDDQCLMCQECEDTIWQKLDEFKTFRTRNSNYDEYYHPQCFLKEHCECDGCGEKLKHENSYFCERNNKTYCDNCYSSECNLGNENNFEALNEMLDENNYTPRNISTIVVKINAIKKIENDLKNILSKNKIDAEWIHIPLVNILYEKIKKQDIQENDRIELLNNLFITLDNEHYLIKAYANKLLEKIKQSKEISEKLSEIFPKAAPQFTNKFFPLNVGYTIVTPHDDVYHDSFVLTMWPTEEMENECINKFKQEPMIEDIFEKFFKNGHHDGSIAYARVSVQGNVWILNNLQRDADIYRHSDGGREINPAYKEIYVYLEKQIKDTWAPQILIQLKLLANQAKAKLYMTPFDIQKDKWRAIPDRNKSVYDEVPKLMGLHQENLADKNIEGIGNVEREMWRVANRANRLIKLSRF